MTTTPSQTVGPFFHFGLLRDDLHVLRPGGVTLRGRVLDGRGEPAIGVLLEVWQADPEGRYPHPADPRGAQAGHCGFGRAGTQADGGYRFETVQPGPVPHGETEQAPHLNVAVFGRGLVDHLMTRVYFPDEPANDRDPVLTLVPPERRGTLVARRIDDSTYEWDVVLQGPHETVFLDPRAFGSERSVGPGDRS